MTDEQLAQALIAVNQVERQARAHLAATTDSEEQRAAQVVLRQAVAVRKPLEGWIASRACRAAMVP